MEQFWRACDATGPLRLGVEPLGSATAQVQVRTLDQPFALVGRDPRCDVHLADEQVGRRHLFLQVFGGRLLALDMGSRTGTWWPDGPRRFDYLATGESLRIGTFRIHFEGVGRGTSRDSGSDPDGALAPPGDEGPLLPHGANWPALALIFGEGEGRKAWRMKQVVSLAGSCIGCKPRLEANRVSSHHCALVRTPLGAWVIDLLGRNGLAVNASIARFAPLEHGDHLRIGRVHCRVRCQSRAAVPAQTLLRTPQGAATGHGPDPSAPVVRLAELERFQMQMFEQFEQIMMLVIQRFDTLHRDQSGRIRDELDRLVELREDLQGLRGETSAHLHRWKALRAPFPPPLPAPAPVSRGPQPPPTPPPDTGTETDVIFSLQERLAAIQSEQQTRWQKILGLLTGQPSEGPAL